ncbi:hypothetical protein BH11PLA2_BH11PLA2_15530 [soil metagenome]
MNRRHFLTLSSLGLSPWVLCGAPKRELFDEAINNGLLHLRRTQNPANGSWSGASINLNGGAIRGGEGGGDPGVSALAVMAFLSAGHVPGEGPHGAAVEKGIRFVMGSQSKNGLIGTPGGGLTEMYHHGICTLMLAEAAGMTSGPLAEELNKRLETAINVILTGQRKGAHDDRGGWRYQVNGFDADLSVTGWQLLALRAARNLGCDVPAEKIQSAVDYVRRCFDRNTGGFRYTVRDRVTVACTGTGILALELCGKEHHKSAEVLAAGKFILDNDLDPARSHFFYGIYYTSQAMFQLGDEFWKQYRKKLHQMLLRLNPPRNDGAWYAGSNNAFDDDRWGPNYCTSMAILALTVEYRYLPIYQRFEEPIEKDGP